MDYRLPYYMAYPMPLQYDDDRIEERDFEYMKSMYPETAKRLLPYVEDECDRMAYEGSVVYDEYPDQLQLRMMCSRIYDRVKDLDLVKAEEIQLEAQQRMGDSFRDWDDRHRDDRHRDDRHRDNRQRDLIEILLFHELFRRRSDHRRRSRRFY